ncbi:MULTISPECIES: DUF1269 domain-containing protein [unclassified Ornithinimicrobium]|uniref:DUF1269 domain-containing protein n=1 Tax=unclassified Ornithinimicrobium TaxID=2615080 RepID=UPI003852BD02
MSELIIIGYDDHETARRAFAQVEQLQRDFVVDLDGLAVVTVDEKGKKHVDTTAPIVGASAASGVLWGMLVGILFLVPGLGAVVGGAMGALSGKLAKTGIDRSFRDRVGGMLQPGSAAVVVMTRKLTEDKFSAAMAEFGGTVLQTSLSDEDEKGLADELATTQE